MGQGERPVHMEPQQVLWVHSGQYGSQWRVRIHRGSGKGTRRGTENAAGPRATGQRKRRAKRTAPLPVRQEGRGGLTPAVAGALWSEM